MHSRHSITAVAAHSAVVFAANLTAAWALGRLVRRRPATAATVPAVPAATRHASDQAADKFTGHASDHAANTEAVLLAFIPRGILAPEPAPQRSPGAVRCGDTGGRTRSGAPCGARPAADGRCRHHRLAA